MGLVLDCVADLVSERSVRTDVSYIEVVAGAGPASGREHRDAWKRQGRPAGRDGGGGAGGYCRLYSLRLELGPWTAITG